MNKYKDSAIGKRLYLEFARMIVIGIITKISEKSIWVDDVPYLYSRIRFSRLV